MLFGVPKLKNYIPPVTTASVKKKDKKDENTEKTPQEEFISTGDVGQTIDPKCITSSSEILGKVEGFAKDNPTWMSFMEGIAAGVVAGKVTKGAELSKEAAAYMEDLKTNIKKTYKKSKHMNMIKNILVGISSTSFLGSLGLLGVNALVGWFSSRVSDTWGMYMLGNLGLSAGLFVSTTSIASTADKVIPQVNVKGDKFVPAGFHEKDPAFLSIIPGTNKLLQCVIKKDEVNGELSPKIIMEKDLPDNPTSITLGKKLKIKNKDDKPNEITYGAVIRYENPNLTSYINDVREPDKLTTDNKEEHDKLVQNEWNNITNRLKDSGVKIKANN